MENQNSNNADPSKQYGSYAYTPYQIDSNSSLQNYYCYNEDNGNAGNTTDKIVAPTSGNLENIVDYKSGEYPYNYNYSNNYNYGNDTNNMNTVPNTNNTFYDPTMYYGVGCRYVSNSSYYHPPPPNMNNSFSHGNPTNAMSSVNAVVTMNQMGRMPYMNRPVTSFPSVVESHKYHLQNPDPNCKLCNKHRIDSTGMSTVNTFVHPPIGSNLNTCARVGLPPNEMNNVSDIDVGEKLNEDVRKDGDNEENNASLEMINTTTYNINTLLRNNILSSEYFRSLSLLKNYKEVIDEIYAYVNHVEPYCAATSRAPSTIFCCLYKLLTMHLSEKQLRVLLDHKESCYVKACGFLYLRYVHNPSNLWKWFEPYLLDEEEFVVSADKRKKKTIGEYVQSLLAEDKYFSTVLPRLPIKLKNVYGARLMMLNEHRRRLKENREIISSFVKGEQAMAYVNGEWEKGEIGGIVNQGKDKVLVKFRRIDGIEKMVNLGYVKLERKESEKDSSTSRRESIGRSKSGSLRNGNDRKRRKRSRSRDTSSSNRHRRNKQLRRSKDRHRDSIVERSRDRNRDKDRDRDRDRNRDRDKDRYGDRDRDRDRDKDRYRNKDRDRRRERNKERSRERSRERNKGKHREKHRERNRERDEDKKRRRSRDHHRERSPIERDGSSYHRRYSYDRSSRESWELSSSRRDSKKETKVTKRDRESRKESEKTEDELINKFRKKEREKAVATGRDYAKRPTSYKSSLSLKVSNLSTRRKSVSKSRSLEMIKPVSSAQQKMENENSKNGKTMENSKLKELMQKYNKQDNSGSSNMSSDEDRKGKWTDTEEPEVVKLG